MTVLDKLKERLELDPSYANRCEINYRIYILSSLADLKKCAEDTENVEIFSAHQKAISKVLYHMLNDSVYKPWDKKELEDAVNKVMHKYGYYSNFRNYKAQITSDIDYITKLWYAARQKVISL